MADLRAEAAELMTEANISRTLLRRLEIFAYWLVAPLVARLPSKLAYGIACRRGDWLFRDWLEGTAIITRNLRQIFGETLSPAEAERVAREAFRAGSCDVIDIMRLRSRTRPLRKLVEIRGREHLEAAIVEGKGAILCTAHFGSYDTAFSLIHADGFPVTAIGHWWWNLSPGDISGAYGGSGISHMVGAYCGIGNVRTLSRGQAGSCPPCRQLPPSVVTRW